MLVIELFFFGQPIAVVSDIIIKLLTKQTEMIKLNCNKMKKI